MTDPAPTNGALQPFDGTPVLRSTIQITKAGDGLSEAMKVEPREFHLDDEVYVVIKTRVSRVAFKPMSKDDDYLQRIHTLEAGDATIVDASLVGEVVAAQAERILRAKEEAEGVTRIPFADGEGGGVSEDGLRLQHELGEHEDDEREGCPLCDGTEDAAEPDALADVVEP